MGHDRGAELALEPLDDHRVVGLAHRAQDLLARRAALEPNGRLLLEHARQRRTHLVEIALALWLDGDHQRRLGEAERRQDQRLLADAQRVAGGGHGQLGDRADLAGLELADRLLLLAVEEEQLADPLVLALAAVPDVGLRMERARQHPQIGQPPDERVGGRLEHAHEQRSVLVGLDLHRSAALVLRLRRRLVGRGGEVADDRVEQRAQPDPARGAADEDRREDRILDALAQARLELGIGDLLALEVLGQHVVVGLGRRLEQLVAPAVHLVGQLLRDRDLFLGRAVPAPGLAVDEVDVALEGVGGPDRQLERGDLLAEARSQRVECGRRVGVLAVALVDEEAGRGAGPPSDRDRLLEPGLDPGRGVHHEDRAVRRGEALDHVGDEVRVAGRVEQRDPRPVRLERADREAERLAPLLLLGLEIEVGRPVVDPTQPRDRPALEQQLLAERRLAGSRVAGQDDAPKVGEVDALHRHRLRRSFLLLGDTGRRGERGVRP